MFGYLPTFPFSGARILFLFGLLLARLARTRAAGDWAPIHLRLGRRYRVTGYLGGMLVYRWQGPQPLTALRQGPNVACSGTV